MFEIANDNVTHFEDVKNERDKKFIQGYALPFYRTVKNAMPSNISLIPDCWDEVGIKGKVNWRFQKVDARPSKQGTVRMEYRFGSVFSKIVIRNVKQNALHHRNVLNLIKMCYPKSKIDKSRSKSGNGFTLFNEEHMITMEVFMKDGMGNLACDITVPMIDEKRTQMILSEFVEFVGTLNNILGQKTFNFNVMPVLPSEVNLFNMEPAIATA